MQKFVVVLSLGTLLAGCTSMSSLNSALGTPKNPTRVFADPGSRTRDNETIFLNADFTTLLEAVDMTGDRPRMRVLSEMPNYDMRRYLAAGYNLADAHCSRYFDKTDEAYRRRRYGRTLTNDVGTAATTILGIAGAAQGVVTGLAAATGLADSSWRNYDDSFVISPELASVKTLVQAAKDNYRARTLGKDAEMPADFGTAHSTIRRYAEFCSHLGMRSLLEKSAGKEEQDLQKDTAQRNASDGGGQPAPAPAPPAPTPAPAGPAPAGPMDQEPAPAPPVTSVPAFPSNKPQ